MVYIINIYIYYIYIYILHSVFATVTECDCFYDGTDRVHICNITNGQCICAEGIIGPKCNQCEGMGHFIIENATCTGTYLCLFYSAWLVL